MAMTYRVTETGKPNSSIVFQTTDLAEARAWCMNTTYVIHYDGIEGMPIEEFEAMSDEPGWGISKKLIMAPTF
jgi:hypothetical protein